MVFLFGFAFRSSCCGCGVPYLQEMDAQYPPGMTVDRASLKASFFAESTSLPLGGPIPPSPNVKPTKTAEFSGEKAVCFQGRGCHFAFTFSCVCLICFIHFSGLV